MHTDPRNLFLQMGLERFCPTGGCHNLVMKAVTTNQSAVAGKNKKCRCLINQRFTPSVPPPALLRQERAFTHFPLDTRSLIEERSLGNPNAMCISSSCMGKRIRGIALYIQGGAVESGHAETPRRPWWGTRAAFFFFLKATSPDVYSTSLRTRSHRASAGIRADYS